MKESMYKCRSNSVKMSSRIILLFILFLLFGLLPHKNLLAQYCTPAPSSVDGSGITRVVFGTIDNVTGDEAGHYGNYSAMSNSVAQGATANVQVRYTTGYTYYTYIWVDWNNDGDFYDAGEQVVTNQAVSTGTLTAVPFTVPAGATLGAHRMRIGGWYSSGAGIPCYVGTWASFEDYTLTVTAPVAMSFVSCTASQPNTSDVVKVTSDAEIARIEVVTSGTASPFDVTGFRIRTNGSDDPLNDISSGGVHIYYTGTSSTFAATNEFGFANPAAAGANIDIAGTQTLNAGTNYFWIAFDIDAGATLGNLVDATCNVIQMSGGVGNQIPSTTAPAGNREIINVSYCTPAPTSVDGTGITRVVFGTIDNSTGDEPNHYGDYTAMSNQIAPGATANVDITYSTGWTYGTKIWIDYNDDGDFNDSGEQVYYGLSTSSNPTTLNASFTVGTNVGAHRMRIGGTDNDAGGDPCYTGSYGSYEDYTIIVGSLAPMAFVSSTTTQAVTSDVSLGMVDQQIIGIEIVTSGSSTPFNVTQFVVRTDGSTAPLADIPTGTVNIYYTGTDPNFLTSNIFGSANPATTGVDINITGTQQLTTGTNYFWLTYDIDVAATLGDQVDASCLSIVMDGVGGTQTPSVINPGTGRTIAELPHVFAIVIEGTNTYWGRSVIHEASSDSYVMASYSSDAPTNGGRDFTVIKTDIEGNPRWTKRIGTANTDNVNDIVECADGSGYVMVGYTDWRDLLVIKVDTSGAEVWSSIIVENFGDDQEGNSIVELSSSATPANGFLIAGQNNGDGAIWILNPDGTIYDDKYFPQTQEFEDAIETSDGYYLVVGTHNESGSNNQFEMVKLDPSNLSTAVWDRQWGSGSSDYLYSVVENGVGDYTVFGILGTGGAGSSDFYAMRVTEAGGVQWARAYGGANGEQCYDATYDGTSYYMTGITSSLGGGGDEVYTIKINSSGDMQWGNVVGTGTWDDEGYAIARPSTGGVVVTGLTNNSGTNQYFLKIDEDNGYHCCTTGSGGTQTNLAIPTLQSYQAAFGFSFNIGSITNTLSQPSLTVYSDNPTFNMECETPLLLPIELNSFYVVCTEGNAELIWSTSSETNNDYFTVERSYNGTDFTAIARIDGAGNSNTTQFYSFRDLNPQLSSIPAYYRIKQTDFNGKYSYSPVSVANCSVNNSINCDVFPNPFNSSFFVNINSENVSGYNILISDYLGKIVAAEIIPSGLNRIELDMSDLSEGVYFIQIYNETDSYLSKIVKVSK